MKQSDRRILAASIRESEVAEHVKHIVVPANEQNLDRLSAEVLRQPNTC